MSSPDIINVAMSTSNLSTETCFRQKLKCNDSFIIQALNAVIPQILRIIFVRFPKALPFCFLEITKSLTLLLINLAVLMFHAQHATCKAFYVFQICSVFPAHCTHYSNLSLSCRWRSWPTSRRSPATTARHCTPSSWPPGYTGCGGRKCGWAAAAAEARAQEGPQTRISGLGGSMTQVRKWLEDTVRRCSILIWPGSRE